MKFLFDIQKFADEFGPLSNALIDHANDATFTTLEDFVRLEKDDWKNSVIDRILPFEDLIDPDEKVEWPESVPGETNEEKRSNYALILFRRVNTLFPMARFRFKIIPAGAGVWTGWVEVKTFLDENESFDFADEITLDILGYSDVLTNEEKTALKNLYENLSLVQRLYRLTPEFSAINGLIMKNLTSAMSIANMNTDDFVKNYSNLAGGVDDAQALHAAAVHTASQTLFLMGTFNQQSDLSKTSLSSITEKLTVPDTPDSTPIAKSLMAAAPRSLNVVTAKPMAMSATTLAEGAESESETTATISAQQIIPDIATLFGRQNQCLCQECQSIFSPSAYMVDLMEFLNDSVRSVLFSRRLDLAQTDLSCRNTNGPVAYIDLVNEILEDAVCSRTFYITDSASSFLNYLNASKALQESKSPNVKRPAIPEFVLTEFDKRGFHIDKNFYTQAIKGDDRSWYLVGDSWRHLIEQKTDTAIFLITPYPQTGKDAQLRRAKPEHTNKGAYEVLKHSPYPVLLPFSLAFKEVNEFLKLKNSRRYKLYHALSSKSEMFSITESSQMQAFFEMTDRQLELILGINVNPWELWGLEQTVYDSKSNSIVPWYEFLSNAQAVIDCSGFTFKQLLDILSTYMIWWNHQNLYLDDEMDDSIERGELSEILIGNPSSGAFFDIARFHRLCTHLGLDVFTVDRLMTTGALQNGEYGARIDFNEANLKNLFVYLRVAEEFSVPPLQAAVWLSGWIDNFNLGRGPASQLEQLFINTIESPKRAAIWKNLLNDTVETNVTRSFDFTGDLYGGDIGTLLKGLKVNYGDLSLIAYYEFLDTDNSEPASEPDAKMILSENLLIVSNLAKMLRVADFSRALGISVKEFYKLRRIISNPRLIEPFSGEFLYECRAVLVKIKKYGITLDDIDYLLSGNDSEKISWRPGDGDELNLIIKTHSDVIKVKSGYKSDSARLRNAIEEAVINELSSFCKIPIDSGRILLEDMLYYSSGNTSKSLLQRWTEICSGGWKAEFTKADNTKIYSIVPAVNIVAQSTIENEMLPETAKSAKWSSYFVVPENAEYAFSMNFWYLEDPVDPSTLPPGSTPPVTNPGNVILKITDPATNTEITNFNLQAGAVYKVTVIWTAPVTPDLAFEINNLNISCLWKKIGSLDSISTLLSEENTITDMQADLIRFVNSAYLVRTLRIALDKLSFISTNRASISNLNFNNLGSGASYAGLFGLIDAYILNAELPYKKKNGSIFDIWKQAYKPGMDDVTIKKIIAGVINWPQADISTIMDRFNYGYMDCRTTKMWFVMSRTCGLLKKLGISASLGKGLLFTVEENYSGDNTFEQSESLISALKSQYTQAQWIDAAEPIMDRLRACQRDALCAYLLSERYIGDTAGASYNGDILSSLLYHKTGINTGNLDNRLSEFRDLAGLENATGATEDLWNVLDGRTGFYNRAGIYAKYLIDVNMEPCIKTTRIVQANSSIQMLIQRAILNFEHQIELSDKIKQQWTWMKNYRLWEANRKIFLYPENWLEPELRDDKTPLFKELESGLLQKELSRDSIEGAFKAYTSGLSEIANLEVIGAFSEESQSEKVLHVVGRTFHYPHSFFYRRNHDSSGGLGYWSPWEKVDLDITSDVVLPVPFRNKIYLFWPIVEIKEKAVENENGSLNDQKNPLYKDTIKYFELKLAWSELSEGKWSAKRISQQTFLHPMDNLGDEFLDPADIFQFKAEVQSDNVEIKVYAYNKIIEKITVKHKVVRTKTIKVNIFQKKKRTYVEEIEEVIDRKIDAISNIAVYSFGIDNNARLIPVEDKSNMLDSEMIPSGTVMRQNRAEESNDNQESSDFGALEYPQNNILLKRTPEKFACFPTNLSFFENTPKPFFLQLQGKILFFKPVAPPDRKYGLPKVLTPFHKLLRKKLDNKNITFHAIDNFYHPLAEDIVKRANFSSIDDLLTRSTQAYSKDQYPLGYAAAGDTHATHLGNLAFQYQYLPDFAILGDYPTPVNDFALHSAFGVYNWELFFHLPMYIATRLSKDSKFEDAMRWFHFIFNPSGDFTAWEKTQSWASELPAGAKFWNFLPFFSNKGVQDSIFKAVKKSQIPDQDTLLGSLIEDWKNDPFKPHLIARVRLAAYQKSVLMKYLDNLINWGDSLFRLDNMESINEATQLYTHASEILGERPVLLPQLHEMPGLTYTQLKAEGLDQFSNTVIKLENYIPPAPPIKVRFWRAKQAPSRYYYYHYNYNYNYNYNSSVEAIPQRSMQLLRMAPALHYFCIPRNERLISYWDTVDDRMFKIRNSYNIDGIKREIPLFAPSIDPGMLVRAAAMGLNIGALLKDIQSSPTVYRFSTINQKAVELCNELKSFGAELLSALEKKDAENLTLLRSSHEIDILNLVMDIKKSAVQEANHNLNSILKTKENVEERYSYYKQIQALNILEAGQLKMMGKAQVMHVVGNAMTLASAALAPIPDASVGCLVSMMGGPTINAEIAGGKKASAALNIMGNAVLGTAGFMDRDASIFGTMASYKRRWDDWKLQEKLAEKEISQIEKQILAAQIRVKISEYELRNHEKQIDQAQSVKETMESKFSNEDLYTWMSDELNRSYNLLYDITYSAAKKAEKAFQFELGSRSGFISPEIWDSTRKGLLAGQRLMVQLRQMDAAFIENNKREMEITKTVSLKLLGPKSLLELQETGKCTFELPEMLYDIDFPGQYFRRIKTVRITIPCITGPYTNVNARLKLTGSKIRTSTELVGGNYASGGANDDRFMTQPISPMTIATSNAQMDSGMFELNFRDERYLPFEGAGAESSWELELPGEYRQFDYRTITDTILHISYTSRESSSIAFVDAVKSNLDECLKSIKSLPNFISIGQSFPAQFESIISGDEGSVTLDERFLPNLITDYIKRNSPAFLMRNVTVYLATKNPVDPDDISLTIELTKNVAKKETISQTSTGSASASFGNNVCMLTFKDFDECSGYPLGKWVLNALPKTLKENIEDMYLYFDYPSVQEEASVNVEQIA